MSNISNIPTRTLLRLLDQQPVGSELWIQYKGTLLYRHWLSLHGEAAAHEMHSWWENMWRKQTAARHQTPEYVQLEIPAEE